MWDNFWWSFKKDIKYLSVCVYVRMSRSQGTCMMSKPAVEQLSSTTVSEASTAITSSTVDSASKVSPRLSVCRLMVVSKCINFSNQFVMRVRCFLRGHREKLTLCLNRWLLRDMWSFKCWPSYRKRYSTAVLPWQAVFHSVSFCWFSFISFCCDECFFCQLFTTYS